MFDMDLVLSGKANRANKSSASSTYLIELQEASTLKECPRQAIGLLNGIYHHLPYLAIQASELPMVNPERDIHMTSFVSSSEDNELAEFRILNYKDRVIVRAIEEDKYIVFGSQKTEHSREYLGFDMSSTMVVRGPVTIRHTVNVTQDEDDENSWEDGGKDESKVCSMGGDKYKMQMVKYSGHVTLNISGSANVLAFIDITDWGQGVTITLPKGSKFSVERTIPHRFQQKTITMVRFFRVIFPEIVFTTLKN